MTENGRIHTHNGELSIYWMPRSIEYCFKCEHKKGIANCDLICDYTDEMKKLEKDKVKKDKNVMIK